MSGDRVRNQSPDERIWLSGESLSQSIKQKRGLCVGSEDLAVMVTASSLRAFLKAGKQNAWNVYGHCTQKPGAQTHLLGREASEEREMVRFCVKISPLLNGTSDGFSDEADGFSQVDLASAF